MKHLGTDWLQKMEKKSKRRRYIKLAASIIIVALVIGLVGFYIDATIPSYHGPGSIEITIAPDKPFFSQGEAVTFTGIVIDNQSWPVAYPSSEDIRIKKEVATNDSVPVGDVGLNIDYAVKIPTYPANANSSFSWR